MSVRGVDAALSPRCGILGVGEEVIESKEIEHGSREVKRIQNPVKPSQSTVDEHSITHLPFRSWRPQCVMGRGKEMPHLRAAGDGGLPEVHFDFFFLGPEGKPGETIAILCGRGRHCRLTMSVAVPIKRTGTYISRRVIAFLCEIGLDHYDINAKNDNEPALIAIANEVSKIRAAGGGGKFIPENNFTGDMKSNGMIERAI